MDLACIAAAAAQCRIGRKEGVCVVYVWCVCGWVSGWACMHVHACVCVWASYTFVWSNFEVVRVGIRILFV